MTNCSAYPYRTHHFLHGLVHMLAPGQDWTMNVNAKVAIYFSFRSACSQSRMAEVEAPAAKPFS